MANEIKEWIEALQAICEGYTQLPAEGYIVVENPDGDAEGVALRGANPNLVIDCQRLIFVLQNSKLLLPEDLVR